RVRAEVKDPDGIQARTEFRYDAAGHTTRIDAGVTYSAIHDPVTGKQTGVARHVHTSTQYVFDAQGRRVREILDPDGVKQTTEYYYDQNGNVSLKIQRASPDSPTTSETRATAYLYDENNRPTFSFSLLNATEVAVTQTEYDIAGRITKTVRYATPAKLSVVAPLFSPVSGMAGQNLSP
ncbi:hypothetical protein, partial [Parachitinimonas caeni]